MAHPLSLAFLTVADVGPAEAVRVAAAAGYPMLGLRMLPAAPGDGEGPYPLLTDDALLAEVRAAIDETGVVISDFDIVRLNARTDVAEFAPFLERAQTLGARHVLVAGDDPEPERLTERFAGFCRFAAEAGLTADLECMPWTEVPDIAAALRIVEGAGEANAGVLLDPLHTDRCGTTLDEIRAVPPALIHYAQICDGPAEYDRSNEGLIRIARGGRLLPGDGGIDLVGFVDALPDGVIISVEIANRELNESMSPEARARRARETSEAVLRAAGRETEPTGR